MVSNLQHYPYVTITNKTPYATNRYLPSIGGHQLLDDKTYVKYATHFCSNDYIQEIIVSGGTWTASSRGACLVTKIEATLTRPNGGSWECDSYRSSGTSYSQFSIIMGYGDDGCCVLSSHETQWYSLIKRWNEPKMMMMMMRETMMMRINDAHQKLDIDLLITLLI